MDVVQLYSSRVIECAQDNELSDTYKVKFVICDFSTNRNRVKINRDKIEDWMGTLKNKPIVGKIVSTGRGGVDFSNHNMHTVIKRDKNGNTYKDSTFDTSAFGTFTDVGIEKIDDDECIVATCEIWKRFENACALIMKRVESGTLNTSWEIQTLESHYESEAGAKVKILDNGIFLGHCLLGAAVKPAYDCSRVLEVAEAAPEFDMELADAIQQDMGAFAENIEDKEVKTVKIKGIETSEDESKKKIDDKETEPDGEGKETPEKNPAEDEEKKKKETSESDEKDKKEDKPADGDGKKPEGEPTDDPKKKDKEESECKDKDKKVAETEISALTTEDIRQKLREAIWNKRIDADLSFVFPEEHEAWAKSYGRDTTQMDFVRFTYSVEDDKIILSDPEAVKLTVSVNAVNEAIAERDEKIANLNEAVASANEQIQGKDNEIASLNVYKEKFEKAEQERIDAEIAEKKDNLRKYAVSSGLIQEAEVAECGELAQLIETNDEAGIKNVIAERFMAKNAAKKTAPKKEISEAKEEKPRVDLKNYNSEPRDYKDIMKQYLGR